MVSVLDGLIQTLGNVARARKSVQNHSPLAHVSRAFLNSRNFPACLHQAIQTRNHEVIVYSFITLPTPSQNFIVVCLKRCKGSEEVWDASQELTLV